MRVTKEIAEKVRDEYLNNPDKDWKEIAKEHNIVRDQVKKILITYGIYSDSRTELIKSLHEKGLSDQDIADQMLLSKQIISLLTPYDFSDKRVYETHAIKERKSVFGDKPYEKRMNAVLDCLLIKTITDKNVRYSIVPGDMPLKVLRKWIAYVNDAEYANKEGFFEYDSEVSENLTSGTASVWRKLVGIAFYSPHYVIETSDRERGFSGPYDDVIEQNQDAGMQDDPLTKKMYLSDNKMMEISFDGLETEKIQTFYEESIFRIMETLTVDDVIGIRNQRNIKMNSRTLKKDNPSAKSVLNGLTDTILLRCEDKTIKIINCTLSKESDVMNFPKASINLAVRRCQTEYVPVKLDAELAEKYGK